MVVLIIGIVLSFATLAIRDNPEQRLQTEAERFAALLRLASQEAVLQSREVAVVFESNGYHFEVLDQGQWVQSADNVFRPRTLPDGIRLEVEIEGDRLGLTVGRDDESRRGREPRIFLLSGGEMTPFVLEFGDDNRNIIYRVEGDFGGRLTLGD